MKTERIYWYQLGAYRRVAARAELFRDRRGCWRWRLRSIRNGQILASSEAYASKRNALKTAAGLAYACGLHLDMPAEG